MDSDADILIKIKSAFDAVGTDSAERAQDNLARKTRETNREMQNQEKDVANARKALAGLSAGAAASQGSFQGLAATLQVLSSGLAELAARATMVAGAFTAGYAIGKQIDGWLGLSKAIADTVAPLEKVASIQDRIRAMIGDANSMSLGNLKKQFDDLASSAQQTAAEIEKISQIKRQMFDAETQALTAELEAAMPPGPERDRAILAKRREREQGSIEMRRQAARDRYAAAESAQKEGAGTVSDAERKVREAQVIEAFARSNGADAPQMAYHRVMREAAETELATARKRQQQLEDNLAEERAAKWNTMRGLELEERTSKARYTSGSATISAREAEEARREAEQQKRVRDRVSDDMAGIGRQATRRAMETQHDDLEAQKDKLAGRLPAARVADLRAKAAGTYKQTDSAVAAVTELLGRIEAKMKLLEDKIKNLPR
jgi:hypothetical protein